MRRIVFLHIPKAAGTTFAQVLVRQFPSRAILHKNARELDVLAKHVAGLTPAHRRSLRCMHGHFQFGAHALLPGPAVYVGLMRDPVDRVVSAYYFCKTLPSWRSFNVDSLEAFVEHDISLGSRNMQTRMLAGNALPGEPDDPLERAKQHVDRHFAVLGLAERFDETLLLCKRRLDWWHIYYRRANVTKQRAKLADISQEMRDKIRERNSLDISLYEWAQARFQASLVAEGVSEHELATFRAVNRVYGETRRTLARVRDALGLPLYVWPPSRWRSRRP